MPNSRISDRERAELRGPVKTGTDFMDEETEPMCEADTLSMEGFWGGVWPHLGRLQGRASVFVRWKRKALVGITGGGADGTDEFRFDEHGPADPDPNGPTEA